MAKSGACHVAMIKRTVGGKTYCYPLLRRTYREEGKVKHETLANLSHLPLPTVEGIRRSLKGELLVGQDDFEIVRSRPHGHVQAVLKMIDRLGLRGLLDREPSQSRERAIAMIAARILEPESKLATARALSPDTLETTLGEMLGVESAGADDLYEAMDWLFTRQQAIEAKLAARHMSEGTLALYDLTSTYFEGCKCPLAKFGYNRDKKKGKRQIVIGLLCDPQGCPVAVEVFEGNTADPKTIASQINKLRTRFNIKRFVLVGDRGMITSARIREDFKALPQEGKEELPGIDWITALRTTDIRKLVKNGSLQMSLFDQVDLAEVTDADFPGERLVICKNPLLAKERKIHREELLQATENKLSAVAAATTRTKRRLRDKTKIALRAGKALGRFKVNKHFRFTITDNSFTFTRNQQRIDREAMLDGIYVIRTSLAVESLPTNEVVRSYKRLSAVERAFRSVKSVDLHIRPIHHHKADRVRAHVLICMLAYYVEWHMRQGLAPILFDDDDKPSGEALRSSPVAPAQVSPSAAHKATTKQTQDGSPVHSFQSLLRDMGTIVKNRIRFKTTPDAYFDLTTTPTSLQQRAFDLLGTVARYRL